MIRPHPKGVIAHIITTKQAFQCADLLEHPAYKEGAPGFVDLVEKARARTLLGVPLLKEDEVVGVFGIYRQEVRPFGEKQIELVKNFAAQAVIAIENTRLLNELRQRTDDLTESLEQQTATSEVLQVISSSPGDLEPVFARMLENAVRICDATFGNIYRWDGDLHILASHKTPAAFAEARRGVRKPFKADEKDPLGRMILSKRAVHVGDLAAEQVYVDRSSPGAVMGVELGGIRTTLTVPMLKDNELSERSASFVRRCGHSPTSRSSWSRISPPRPSSPSKTRGSLTNCASAPTTLRNRWSSRRQRRRCSTSSAAPQAS